MQYHPIEEMEKALICAWTYPGEYAVYNLPPYEEMKDRGIGFCNPEREKNFCTYFENNDLVGFTNLLEKSNEVFLGVGVRPDCCGHGLGQKIIRLAAARAAELYPGKMLYLEVRTWNHRAIRCYEKAGFVRQGAPFEQKTPSGEGLFYRMILSR